ncbi:Fic family protein [Clostridium sp.]|uniref:Fic family protein n=1 Tax=Clostridium sp. TaxID=1506 RepID=UPI003EEB204F
MVNLSPLGDTTQEVSTSISGSEFTRDTLNQLADKNIVSGTHTWDDVIETRNSLDVFDFIIETLDEPLSLQLIREYHQLLKNGTSDDKKGFSGKFKKIPNMLSGLDEIKLAEPHEVEPLLLELIENYNTKKALSINLHDLCYFHSDFEKIHLFQDGNGRIGRFLLLKQCLENNIDLIAIDEKYNAEYRGALYESQLKVNYDKLIEIFKKCQEYIKSKEDIIFSSNEALKKLKNKNK